MLIDACRKFCIELFFHACMPTSFVSMFKSIVIVSPFEYSSPCCEGFAAWCEHQGQGEKELQRGKQVTNIRYTLSFINMSRPTWTKWHRDSVDFNELRTKISGQSRRWWIRLRWKANCKRICANRSAENSNLVNPFGLQSGHAWLHGLILTFVSPACLLA